MIECTIANGGHALGKLHDGEACILEYFGINVGDDIAFQADDELIDVAIIKLVNACGSVGVNCVGNAGRFVIIELGNIPAYVFALTNVPAGVPACRLGVHLGVNGVAVECACANDFDRSGDGNALQCVTVSECFSTDLNQRGGQRNFLKTIPVTECTVFDLNDAFADNQLFHKIVIDIAVYHNTIVFNAFDGQLGFIVVLEVQVSGLILLAEQVGSAIIINVKLALGSIPLNVGVPTIPLSIPTGRPCCRIVRNVGKDIAFVECVLSDFCNVAGDVYVTAGMAECVAFHRL